MHSFGIMKLNTKYQPATMPAAASRIGRFYIIRELGRGAIGVVFLAHDPTIDRQVAIKTFHTNLNALEKRRAEQQFINEARAAGRLSHPNIVTIYDACSEGDSTYIVMEYLKGEVLSRRLAKGMPFTVNEIATLGLTLATALYYAHRRDVIHRDIKPANIFMTDDGPPKLLDFGIARAPNRLPDPTANSADPFTMFHNNILGTPNYMSPEQALGRTVDARTDIYSLGAVMYEMITRRKPFETTENDQEKLFQMIAMKIPAAPHDIDANVPAALSRIIMKAMSKRPEKRYASAEEMMRDIKRFINGQRRSRSTTQSSSTGTIADKLPSALGTQGLRWLGASMLAGAFFTVFLLWF